MRKLIYLVACSVDGFIARPDGSFTDFPQTPGVLQRIFGEYPETCPVHVRKQLGVDAPPKHFDTVIMGARTHQPAVDAGLTSAYPHLRQYVVTHQKDLPADPSLTLTDAPVETVRRLKAMRGRDIWLCGGGDLAGRLASEIDELHLKLNPVVLGAGIPLFAGTGPHNLTLLGSSPLGDGVLLNRYATTG